MEQQPSGLPPRVLPRTFSYNTFTPPPSTPTLGESSASANPWRLSLPPSRSRTPDLSGIANANTNAIEGYGNPIMEAVDPARPGEMEGLMGYKDEERAIDGDGEGDDWGSVSGSGSEAEGSTMSSGVGKVKAAQAVWWVFPVILMPVLISRGRTSQWFLFFG
jgi:hypothetical protein